MILTFSVRSHGISYSRSLSKLNLLEMTVRLQNESKYYSLGTEGEFNKEQVTSFAEIWECQRTGAKSLHAKIQFLPGDVISPIDVKEYVATPNYLSVQVSEQKHILLSPVFLQYINHSCDPNTFFDTTNMRVVCLKKINIGEAMTFFYPSTEWSMAQGFNCLCGSDNCLETIQGAKYISSEVLGKYKLSDHIGKKLSQ